MASLLLHITWNYGKALEPYQIDKLEKLREQGPYKLDLVLTAIPLPKEEKLRNCFLAYKGS